MKPQQEARRKGLMALGGWGGTAALVLLGAPWILSVAGGAAAGWLTWQWIHYRGRWGMKF